ncbi:methylated-DNA--[protein]-cysteine S-methyltransferase [bacterium]|nr:methylated-DNA--[protein]-cysteine S-methyltransferase [bacterium]MCI0605906.1 methylated-DNA--[protein]-cysteine S-methyltransferase [bacterium]
MKHELIWRQIKKIPRGKVATYGQIARLSGIDGHARLVGYALHGLPQNSGIPWHRVINSQGRISLSGFTAKRQRRLLEIEKVVFNPAGKIDLKRFQWKK